MAVQRTMTIQIATLVQMYMITAEHVTHVKILIHRIIKKVVHAKVVAKMMVRMTRAETFVLLVCDAHDERSHGV